MLIERREAYHATLYDLGGPKLQFLGREVPCSRGRRSHLFLHLLPSVGQYAVWSTSDEFVEDPAASVTVVAHERWQTTNNFGHS